MIRIGIVGTSSISERFAEAVDLVDGVVVHLIAADLFDRSDLLGRIEQEGASEPARGTRLPVRSRNFR